MAYIIYIYRITNQFEYPTLSYNSSGGLPSIFFFQSLKYYTKLSIYIVMFKNYFIKNFMEKKNPYQNFHIKISTLTQNF